MARLIYGGTAAETIVNAVPVTDNTGVAWNVAALAPGVQLQVWTANTGGTRVTDLLDLSSSTLPGGVLVTDAGGRLPAFQGPDGYTADLYVVDPTSLARFRVTPGGLSERIAALETGAGGSSLVTVATDQTITAEKTFSAEDPTKSALVINRTVTVDATTSADVLPISYKGQRATWLNEWGGLRIRVPTLTDLGYGDVALALYGQAGNDTLQVFGSADGSTASCRVREGDLWAKAMTLSGVLTAPASATSSPTLLNGAGQWQDFTTYVNGYSAYASTVLYTPKGRIECGGSVVRLRGRIVTPATTTTAQTICTLPTALRPARQVQVPAICSTGTTTILEINPSGTIVNQRAQTVSWTSLDGVTFYIGAN